MTYLSDRPNLEQELFKLKNVKLEKIPELINVAKNKVKGSGSYYGFKVVISKNSDKNSEVRMVFYYRGGLGGHLTTDLDGKILEFEKPGAPYETR